MRGSFAAPLPILRQIFLCVVDSHRAVRYGGDHLPQCLGAHVAHGEHAGKIRAGGFVRDDIAGLVQRQFIPEQLRRRGASHADEHTVAGKVALRAGIDVLQPKSRQAVFMQQRGDGAVPAEFHVGRSHQRLMIDLRCPQAVAAVDEVDLFCDAGQSKCVRRGRVAAAHHRHGLAPIGRAVAGGAIVNALSRERILALIKELTDRLADYPLPYKVVPSFGICEVDNIDTPINVLCDWANLALKTIKGNYLNSYAFYDGKLRERILEEKKIENQMHDALLQGQFVLYLQPKVHIPTSRIIGSEGLVRWIHPTEGLMPPDRFIPLFEKNGFIIRLDEYIWEQACITLRNWIDHGLTPTPISVNMSRMHIHDPRLREKLLDLMRRYELPPHLLELELTESAFLENESGLFESMKGLQAFGFQFSMDDFGSGYSSLNMLKSMPVDFIKIDRGFLNEVVTTERGKTVIRFSISLAREMSIKVIAEGVETEEQAAFLLQAGCAYAQGYFYSRPLPIPQFEALAFGTEHPFPVAPSIKALAEKLEKDST